MQTELLDVDDAARQLKEAGIDVAGILKGNTYRDMSTCVIVPTRSMIHEKVVRSWMQLQKPMNHRHAMFFVSNDEVAIAYNRAIKNVLDNEQSLGRYEYVLTLEDDNIVPSMALLLLLDSIQTSGFDVMAGLYYMKNAMAVPMAFGRPGVRDGSGEMDWSSVDMTQAIMEKRVEEVNGVACGCTLWKMDLFREFAYPWFTTFVHHKNGTTVEASTQDIAFCKKLREKGKRIGVDARVGVGHLDVRTGTIW